MTADGDPPSRRRRLLLRSVAGLGLFPSIAKGQPAQSSAVRAVSSGSATATWEWTDDHAAGHSVVQGLAQVQSDTVVAAGFETDADGTQNILLRGIDHGGQVDWLETVGGPGGADAALDVTTSAGGDVVFCGGMGSRGSQHLDTAVGTFAPPDTLEWLTAYGKTGTNDAAHAIERTPTNGYVVAGGTHYQGGAFGEGVGRLLSIDEDGTERWDRTYETGYAGELYDVVRTADGEYVFAGTRESGSGDGHAWIGTVDAGGNQQWSETYGGAGSRIAYAVTEAHDGGFVFAGTTTPPTRSTPSAWIGKVGATGGLEWEETYGTPDSDAAVAIERTADGYVAAGWTGGNGWLLSVDATGRIQRQETYGDGDGNRFNALARANDGSVVGGYTIPSGGDPTAWAVGTDGTDRSRDRLVVDASADPGDPEYREIQAAVDDAAPEATIEVRAGTYEESVTIDESVSIIADDGAVLAAPGDGPLRLPGFEIDAETAPDADSTIRGISIDRFSPAIDFSGTDGDWLVEDVTVEPVVGYDRSETQPRVLDARNSSGDWTLRNVTLRGDGDNTVVDARDSTGDWRIEGPSTLARARYGVRAGGTEGDWRIHRTNFVDIEREDVRVFDGDGDVGPVGNARRNWYDGESPDCRGNVLCGNPLGEPASEDATGVEIEILDATGDGDPEPVPEVTVYLLEDAETDIEGVDGRYSSLGHFLSDVDGQELLFNDAVDEQAVRAHESGPDGLVRYTGLDAANAYSLVVVPPAHHTGNIWTATLDLWDRSVHDETVRLTSETHFDYLVDGTATREPVLETITRTLESHIDERREAVLETGFEAADVLDDDLLEVDAGDGATVFMGELASYTAEQVSDGAVEHDLRDGIQDVVKDLAIDAGANALANAQVASLLGRVNEQAPEEAAERYQRYIDDLETVDHDWFNQPNRYDSDDQQVDYTALETYRESLETARNATARLDEFRDTQPPESLNHEHVLEVFLQLEETLDDPAEIGTLDRESAYPTDLVILPDGTVRDTQRGVGHLTSLKAASEEYADRSIFDKIGLGADVVGIGATIGIIAVGTAMILVPEPGSTAAGAAIMLKKTAAVTGTVSTMSDLAAVYDDLSDRELLVLRYMDLHLDSLHDIDSLGLISEDIVGWLEGQYDDPTTGVVDGTVRFQSGGLETSTDDPIVPTDSLSDDDEMELAQGEIDVDYEITGDETVPGRILGFSSYFSDRSNEDSLPRLQGFVTTVPSANESPRQFASGSADTDRLEYQFHHPVEDEFRLHFYTVHLVLEGRHVDTATTSAVVGEEDSGWFASPTVSAGANNSTRQQPYTTAATPAQRPMTAAEVDELRGETTTLLDETLGPGSTASHSLSVAGRLKSTSFVLFHPPGTEVGLRIEDETGEIVESGIEQTASGEFGAEAEVRTVPGGTQITLYPDADVTVTATASVPADRSQPVSMTLMAIEIPERPPVLGTNPTRLAVFGARGRRLAQRFVVTEVGNQRPIEGIDVTPGPLTNATGTALPPESISVESAPRRIEASDRDSARLFVEPPASLELADEPTRFTGTVAIDSETAGTRQLPLSVLLLDTAVDDVDLIDADASVSRVRLATDSLPEAAPEPPGDVRTVYEITVGESGSATLKLDELLAGDESTDVVPMRLVDESYEAVESVGGASTGLLELGAGEHTVVVTEQRVPEVTDPDSDSDDEGGEGDPDESGSDDPRDGGAGDEAASTSEGARVEDDAGPAEFLRSLSGAEVAGIGAVSAGMLYLGVRMLWSDEE
ncbi:right-handed parallel beta-helix repeat-containing protein [Natronolimnohabitans innermongolicus]|uniref:Lipoprotein n=1 Tax=Natronolimnohabitans innermongolicus JCM 12255 TaxID=1227499 RepID=L9WQQ6_9EURY|nr:hypothetical protein [Natronolimnohabitans innermongolicus]ELY51737.1 lipoprotein [Natronolimnohabitans innermongolicus JCM 12255]